VLPKYQILEYEVHLVFMQKFWKIGAHGMWINAVLCLLVVLFSFFYLFLSLSLFFIFFSGGCKHVLRVSLTLNQRCTAVRVLVPARGKVVGAMATLTHSTVIRRCTRVKCIANRTGRQVTHGSSPDDSVICYCYYGTLEKFCLSQSTCVLQSITFLKFYFCIKNLDLNFVLSAPTIVLTSIQ
jgi:hypothetical protein